MSGPKNCSVVIRLVFWFRMILAATLTLLLSNFVSFSRSFELVFREFLPSSISDGGTILVSEFSLERRPLAGGDPMLMVPRFLLLRSRLLLRLQLNTLNLRLKKPEELQKRQQGLRGKMNHGKILEKQWLMITL